MNISNHERRRCLYGCRLFIYKRGAEMMEITEEQLVELSELILSKFTLEEILPLFMGSLIGMCQGNMDEMKAYLDKLAVQVEKERMKMS